MWKQQATWIILANQDTSPSFAFDWQTQISQNLGTQITKTISMARCYWENGRNCCFENVTLGELNLSGYLFVGNYKELTLGRQKGYPPSLEIHNIHKSIVYGCIALEFCSCNHFSPSLLNCLGVYCSVTVLNKTQRC